MTFAELIKESKVNSSGILKLKYDDVCSKNLNPLMNERCVYMIECNNEIVYIGQSEVIRYRLMQHKYKLNFDCVYIGCMSEGCSYRDMLFMEAYLIGIAEPVLNFSDFTRKTFESKDIKYLAKHITYIGA